MMTQQHFFFFYQFDLARSLLVSLPTVLSVDNQSFIYIKSELLTSYLASTHRYGVAITPKRSTLLQLKKKVFHCVDLFCRPDVFFELMPTFRVTYDLVGMMPSCLVRPRLSQIVFWCKCFLLLPKSFQKRSKQLFYSRIASSYHASSYSIQEQQLVIMQVVILF